MPEPVQHVLEELSFPARYEALVLAVGAEVSQLVHSPDAATKSSFALLAGEVRARGEGMFVPITASSGTGKTTLANNLTVFLGGDYRSTAEYTKELVTYDDLLVTAQTAGAGGVANEARILPIVVDNREGNPPSVAEIASIKRFVREQTIGRRSVVLWPETDSAAATEMAKGYVEIAGAPAIDIPAHILGPDVSEWQQIAIDTLELANSVPDLTLLGVDPRDYDPAESRSLGEYLRRISKDFTERRLELLESTQMPLRLTIVFPSGSPNMGLLSQLTNSNKFGFLDASALISATPESVAGRTWASKKSLLTQMIVLLDARAYGLPPQVSVPVLRKHGPDWAQELLAQAGIETTPSKINTAIGRSDLGKFFKGTAPSTFENRGTPAVLSTAAFGALAAAGFQSGRDKLLNKGMLAGLESYFSNEGIGATDFKSETSLGFVPLTPDNSFVIDGNQHCLEYTWRAGEFLDGGRAAVAMYILDKIENYARELGRFSS